MEVAIVKLYKRDERIYVDKTRLLVESNNRAVSFFSKEGMDGINNNERRIIGLCEARFKADIIIENIDCSKVRIGSILGIGNAIIKITEVGKRCFEECNLVQNNLECILKKEVFFGAILQGGEISVGDIVLFKEEI